MTDVCERARPIRQAPLARIALSAVALIFAFSASAPSASPGNKSPCRLGWEETLEADILRIKERARAPGIGVLVVSAECVLFSRSYGVIKIGSSRRVDENSLFQIGSITKGITALALGQLVEHKRISLTQPVRDVLPGFSLRSETGAIPVTIDHLLTHRTGLLSHNMVWYGANNRSASEVVERMSSLETFSPVGERFEYNNLGYIAAGQVIEELAGQPYEEFIEKSIFIPLGIKRARFDWYRDPDNPALTSGHAQISGEVRTVPHRLLGPANAAGGLVASLKDIERYLRMLAGRGALDGRQVFSSHLIDELMAPKTTRNRTFDEPGAGPAYYGYGFNVDRYRSVRRVHHSGSIDGYRSRIVVLPDHQLAVFVTTNLDASPLPEILTNLVVDRLLGTKSAGWDVHALGKIDAIEEGLLELHKADPAHISHNAVFSGHFCNAGYGCLHIDTTGCGQIKISLNNLTFATQPISSDVWQIARPTSGWPLIAVGTYVTVQRDAKGAVSAVAIDFNRTGEPVRFIRQNP